MARATSTASQTQAQPEATLQPAEKIRLSSLPTGAIKLSNGTERPCYRIHSLSFLPGSEGHPATFGGFLTDYIDPQTGEVRGSGDSVALSLFRQTAIGQARLCIESWLTPRGADEAVRADIKAQVAEMPLEDIQAFFKERSRDALLIVPRADIIPAETEVSLYRYEDGRARFIAADSEAFGGAHRWLRASRPLDEGAL